MGIEEKEKEDDGAKEIMDIIYTNLIQELYKSKDKIIHEYIKTGNNLTINYKNKQLINIHVKSLVQKP